MARGPGLLHYQSSPGVPQAAGKTLVNGRPAAKQLPDQGGFRASGGSFCVMGRFQILPLASAPNTQVADSQMVNFFFFFLVYIHLHASEFQKLVTDPLSKELA